MCEKVSVWERFKYLLCKLLGIKVIGAIVATWLLCIDKIEGWMWLIIFSAALGLRSLEKYINKR